MHMINEEKVDLDPSLAERLITATKGLVAGGSSDRDLIDCPKQNQPQYDICKDCQFSVPLDLNLDAMGV